VRRAGLANNAQGIERGELEKHRSVAAVGLLIYSLPEAD
jgi:hypothetical protein